MAVAPNANALITTAEARSFFPGLASTGQDDLLQEIVNEVSDYVVNVIWGRWTVKKTTYTNRRMEAPREHKLSLPILAPIDVASPLTVSFDGIAQTVWKQESDGDRANFDVIVRADRDVAFLNHLWRRNGWLSSTDDPDPILLTITVGFATIPDDVKRAAKMAAQTFYRHREQPQDVAQYGAGSASPGVVFRPESLIPMQAKVILDSYRVVPL